MNESLFVRKHNDVVSISCFQFIIHCTFTLVKLCQTQGFIDSSIHFA